MSIIIHDNCILCPHKFTLGELVTGKLPENIWFCRACLTKFKDTKSYKGVDAWVSLPFSPNIEFELKGEGEQIGTSKENSKKLLQ